MKETNWINVCKVGTCEPRAPAPGVITPGVRSCFLHLTSYYSVMARPIRIEFPGAFYHVTTRGNNRGDVFLSDDDRRLFLRTLGDVIDRFNWVVHAYCLMTNHYHLLLETPEANLSAGMRQVNGIFTQKINRRYRKTGHLFQGRFKAFLVDADAYFLEVARYIVLNPSRAGMVSHPEEWPWSSYRATAGTRPADPCFPDLILKQFSNRKKTARKMYRDYVAEGSDINPFDQAKGGLVLGTEAFVSRIQSLIENHPSPEHLQMERTAGRPSLEEIFNTSVRDEAIYQAVHKWNYPLKKVGKFKGLHYSTISRIASRWADNLMKKTDHPTVEPPKSSNIHKKINKNK